MKSNTNIIPYRTWSAIPRSWEARPNVINYDQLDPSEHIIDGWRDVVNPVIGENQRRGGLIYDEPNDVFTYEVIDLTTEEIQQRIASQAEGARQEALNQKLLAQADESFQAIDDPDEALDNQEAFPLWSLFEDGHLFPVNFKVQDFEGLELKLYNVIQQHQKQSNWFPSNVPALFVKILPAGSPQIWEAGIAVTVGQVWSYQNVNYTVLQSHTTQLGWEPPNVPALWELTV
jgi:hypothetical protein